MKFFNVLCLFTLVGGLLFSSCGDQAANAVDAVDKTVTAVGDKVNDVVKKPKPKPVNTVSLGEARAWSKKWTDDISATNMPLVQGFRLPAEDLREVLHEDITYARFYLGKIASTGEYKMVVVGVDSLGNDMLDSTATPPQLVYDVSFPCPTACGSFIPGD